MEITIKKTFLDFLNDDTKEIPKTTFFQILNRIFRLKQTSEDDPCGLCTCSKLYQLRTREIHEADCIVGISRKCWSKLEKLAEMSDFIRYRTKSPYIFCKGQYEGLDSFQKKEEYEKITALRDDAVRLLKKLFMYILNLPYEKPTCFDIEQPLVTHELLLGSPDDQRTPIEELPRKCFYGIYPKELFYRLLENIVIDAWMWEMLNEPDYFLIKKDE